MAIARKCDRCGKLYEYYPQGNKSQCNGVQRIYITITGGYDSGKPCDLCPECMTAFDEFMINGKFMENKDNEC